MAVFEDDKPDPAEVPEPEPEPEPDIDDLDATDALDAKVQDIVDELAVGRLALQVLEGCYRCTDNTVLVQRAIDRAMVAATERLVRVLRGDVGCGR